MNREAILLTFVWQLTAFFQRVSPTRLPAWLCWCVRRLGPNLQGGRSHPRRAHGGLGRVLPGHVQALAHACAALGRQLAPPEIRTRTRYRFLLPDHNRFRCRGQDARLTSATSPVKSADASSPFAIFYGVPQNVTVHKSGSNSPRCPRLPGRPCLSQRGRRPGRHSPASWPRRRPNLAPCGLNGTARSSCPRARPRPQLASSHYGMSQFKKWLRWMETHHHETTRGNRAQIGLHEWWE